MKVLAVMGSPRKGQTDRLMGIFEKELTALGKIEFEYLFLRDQNLQACKGCAACLEIGEEKCPLNDDRDLVLQLLEDADGVIFATPNYSLQVTGLMKLFLDRFCFVFHRARFFHKASIAFVTQGVFGGGDIVRYIDNVAGFWGFNTCKGVVLDTPWGVRNPKAQYPEKESGKIERTIRAAAIRFYKELLFRNNRQPSMKRLLFFRLTRSAHKYSGERKRDYEYFSNNGWLESDYFYNVKLGIHKKVFGMFIDKMIENQAKKNKEATRGRI